MNTDRAEITVKGRLIALIIGAIVMVIVVEITLRIALPSWRDFYSGNFMRTITVPSYGHVTTGIPGFDGYFAQNNGDFRVHISINKFGLRNPKPITESDNSIWVIGDSMAFGWGVEQVEMYSAVLQKKLGFQTYNVASPGTNVCGYQALLARMPKSLLPRAVVLGLILENDVIAADCQMEVINEIAQSSKATDKPTKIKFLKTLKSRLTKHSALYNFFAISLKRVDFIHRALTKIGIINEVNHFRRPGRGDDFELATAATAKEILRVKQMLSKDTPFVVLIAPGRFEINDGNESYARLRGMMNAALKKLDIEFVDLFNEFAKAGYDATHFAHDGHWSALGHSLAAEKIAAHLKPRLK
jgi:lysophospholipase L1-like esterase